MRERARLLDDRDFLRRVFLGGEPARIEAELDEVLAGDEDESSEEPEDVDEAATGGGAKVVELAAWVQHANRVIDEAGG